MKRFRKSLLSIVLTASFLLLAIPIAGYAEGDAVQYTAKFNAASYNLTAATYTMKATITREDETGVLEQSGNTTFSGKTASIKVARADATSFASGSAMVALVKNNTTYATTTVNYSPSATITTDSSTKMIEEGPEAVTALKINGVAVDIADYVISSDDETAATVEKDGSNVTITPLKAGKASFTVAKASDSSVSVKASTTFKNAAAKLGDTYYETVDKALKAAKSGDTVTLASDVTESVSFNGNTPREDEFKITLDLAGHTLTGKADTAYALKTEYGIFTVKDSVGGGGVHYGSDYAFIVSHLAGNYTSRLVLESGTFTGKTTVAQAGLSGGSGTNKKYYGGEIEVKGGTFVTVPDENETYDENGNFKYTLNKLDYNASSYPGGQYSPSEIIVSGGTFHKFDPSNNLAEGVNTNFVKTDYSAVLEDAENRIYKILPTGAVAQNTDTGVYYSSISEAINNAENDDNIKLLINTTENFNPGNIKASLDLDGHTLAVDANEGITVNAGGDLTIKNGKINSSNTDILNANGGNITLGDGLTVTASQGAAIYAHNSGTVTIDGATVSGGAGNANAFASDNGSIVVKSGELSSDTLALSVNGTGTATIEGGAVKGGQKGNDGGAIRAGSGNYAATNGVITIKGGTVTTTATSLSAAWARNGGKIIVADNGAITAPKSTALVATANSAVEVKGGTVTSSDSGWAVFAHEGGNQSTAKATISGGTINGAVGAGSTSGKGEVTVEGGVINGDLQVANGSDFNINGGYFKTATGNGAAFIRKDNKKLVKVVYGEQKGMHELGDAVCSVGDNLYAAVDQAKNSGDTSADTIVLLKDDEEYAYFDKSWKLDLNGHELSATGEFGLFVASDNTLTVLDSSAEKTGKIVNLNDYKGDMQSAIYGIDATIVIDGARIECTNGNAIRAMYSTVTINDGSFIKSANGQSLFGTTTGSIKINGGMFSDDYGNGEKCARPANKYLADLDKDGWYELTDLDKSALDDAIKAAQYAEKDVPTADNEEAVKDLPNGLKYTTSADKEALDDAIKAAQAALEKTTGTQRDIDEAETAIKNATQIYNAAKKTVSVSKDALTEAITAAEAKEAEKIAESTDGKDLKPGTAYVTPTEKQALKDAIEAAQTVANKSVATQNEINSATETLNAAKATYEEAARKTAADLDKSALDDAIKAAQDAEEGVETSADGKDIDPAKQWTTDAAKKALDDAIAAAQEAAAKEDATQKGIDDAAAALKDATDAYNNAKKNGSKPAYGPEGNPNQKGKDGTAVGSGASAASADKAITTSPSEEGPAGTKYMPLALRSTKQGKKNINLTWNKISGAKSYVVYGNACGKNRKMVKLATLGSNKLNVKRISTNLKKKTYYKFIVVALDSDNNVVSTSKVVHVATKGGKVTN